MGFKDIAEKYMKQHRDFVEDWSHGDIQDMWMQDGIPCIRYQDGKWYHYRETANGLEWW